MGGSSDTQWGWGGGRCGELEVGSEGRTSVKGECISELRRVRWVSLVDE